MKIIVVYYSFSGNNEVLARELQSQLGCEIYKVTTLKKKTAFQILLDVFLKRSPGVNAYPDALSLFDHIVLVAPIWNGHIANPLKSFLKIEKESIKNFSFITLCGVGRNQKVYAELTKLLESKPVAFAELKILDLLPPDKRDKIKYTSGYQVQQAEMSNFNNAIAKFLEDLKLNQE